MNHTKFNNENILICFAGGSCTGKGVIFRSYIQNSILNANDTVVISSELAKEKMPELKGLEDIRHPEKMREHIKSYRDFVLTEACKAMSDGKVVVIDDHFEKPDLARGLLEQAKIHGYKTLMIGSFSDPEHYFSAQESRARNTGLPPPDPKMGLETHKGFAETYSKIKDWFDGTILYYYFSFGKTCTHDIISYREPGKKETIIDKEKMLLFNKVDKINVNAKAVHELYNSGNCSISNADCRQPRPSEHEFVGSSGAANSTISDIIYRGKEIGQIVERFA